MFTIVKVGYLFIYSFIGPVKSLQATSALVFISFSSIHIICTYGAAQYWYSCSVSFPHEL